MWNLCIKITGNTKTRRDNWEAKVQVIKNKVGARWNAIIEAKVNQAKELVYYQPCQDLEIEYEALKAECAQELERRQSLGSQN